VVSHEFGNEMKAIYVTVALLVALVPGAYFLLSFDTQYAPGYTERAFKSVKIGDTKERVISLLGAAFSTNDSEPYMEWIYSGDKQPRFSKDGEGSGTFTTVKFKQGSVDNIWGQRKDSATSFTMGQGVGFLQMADEEFDKLKGASQDKVRQKFGAPMAIYEYKASKLLWYSRSPSSSNYHQRMLGLDEQGKVVHIWRSIYWD